MPRRMADMSGLSTRQRTMTRTRVNPSSITLNFDSFPLCPGLSGPGMRVFFCFGKALPEDEGKPEAENTLPQVWKSPGRIWADIILCLLGRQGRGASHCW